MDKKYVEEILKKVKHLPSIKSIINLYDKESVTPDLREKVLLEQILMSTMVNKRLNDANLELMEHCELYKSTLNKLTRG
jgi:hypothetical protein